jgi:hypothetical protein
MGSLAYKQQKIADVDPPPATAVELVGSELRALWS